MSELFVELEYPCKDIDIEQEIKSLFELSSDVYFFGDDEEKFNVYRTKGYEFSVINFDILDLINLIRNKFNPIIKQKIDTEMFFGSVVWTENCELDVYTHYIINLVRARVTSYLNVDDNWNALISVNPITYEFCANDVKKMKRHLEYRSFAMKDYERISAGYAERGMA